MATYLSLTNEVLREMNKVALTSSTFAIWFTILFCSSSLHVIVSACMGDFNPLGVAIGCILVGLVFKCQDDIAHRR